MKKILLVLSVAILNFFGCASFKNHKHATGSVVALDSAKEAHVCMDSAEVKPGDKLSLFQSICTSKERKLGHKGESLEQTTCTKVSRGFVEVISTPDPHFIKVRALGEAVFEQGFIVEELIKE